MAIRMGFPGDGHRQHCHRCGSVRDSLLSFAQCENWKSCVSIYMPVCVVRGLIICFSIEATPLSFGCSSTWRLHVCSLCELSNWSFLFRPYLLTYTAGCFRTWEVAYLTASIHALTSVNYILTTASTESLHWNQLRNRVRRDTIWAR